MLGKSPYFFDAEKGIIYEYVVDGAYLYCQGCELSRTTLTGRLRVLTQDFCWQNNKLSANEKVKNGFMYLHLDRSLARKIS